MDEAGGGRGKAARLKQLVADSRALATVEAVDAVLPVLLRMALEAAQAAATCILLYDPTRKALSFALGMHEPGTGARTTWNHDLELEPGQGVPGHVAATRRPVRADAGDTDDAIARAMDEAAGFSTRSLVGVPLLFESELLGVVLAHNAVGRAAFDADDVDILESFAHLAGAALVRARLMECRLRERGRGAELEAAARIQRYFRPSPPESSLNLEMAGSIVPATVVGGDLYDFIPLADGAWLVCVGDVSGKGLPAAMAMAATWAKLRTLAASVPDVDELLARLNDELWDLLQGAGFVTLVAARYQPATQDVSVALAGHVPPLLCGAAGAAEAITGLRGMPLGVDRQARYEPVRFRLRPGERVLLVSDGVTEARDPDGALYGVDRLLERCAGHQGLGLADAVQDAVGAWRQGHEADDDTTVAVFGRGG